MNRRSDAAFVFALIQINSNVHNGFEIREAICDEGRLLSTNVSMHSIRTHAKYNPALYQYKNSIQSN